MAWSRAILRPQRPRLAFETGDAFTQEPEPLDGIGRGMVGGVVTFPRHFVLEKPGYLRQREAGVVAQTLDGAQPFEVGLVV